MDMQWKRFNSGSGTIHHASVLKLQTGMEARPPLMERRFHTLVQEQRLPCRCVHPNARRPMTYLGNHGGVSERFRNRYRSTKARRY